MSLLGEKAVATIQEYLTSLGYRVEVARQDDAFNQVHSYGAQEESTYFFVSDYINAYPVGEYVQGSTTSYTAFIESDTVTGEVHRLSLYFPNLQEGCQLIERLYQENGIDIEAAQADWEQLRIDLQALVQNPSILRDVWERPGECLQLSIEDHGGEYYAVLMPYQG